MNEFETAARVRTHLQNVEREREAILEPEIVNHVPLNAKMVVHSGAKRITRPELRDLPEPVATDTFKPILHYTLIDQIEEVLAFRHLNIIREDYAIKDDGMKLFALLELSSETEDVRFALALRTANDKSMSLKMTTGYRVFICDNMAMSGEFQPLAHKHSKHFDLTESLTIGIDRAQRYFSPLTKQIGEWKQKALPEATAKKIIYDAFTGDYVKAPIKLLKQFHEHYFEDKRFERDTFWALSNAGTSSFKELKPTQQYECTARWGKFLNTAYNNLN